VSFLRGSSERPKTRLVTRARYGRECATHKVTVVNRFRSVFPASLSSNVGAGAVTVCLANTLVVTRLVQPGSLTSLLRYSLVLLTRIPLHADWRVVAMLLVFIVARISTFFPFSHPYPDSLIISTH
jgi:uncharacterized membrane protein YczE